MTRIEDEHLHMDSLRRNTTVQRAIPMGTNTLRSFANMARYNALSNIGRPLSGTAVVVGAGPSLDDDLPELKRMSEAGEVIVLASNTAAPALAKAGIPIDILVLIESLDMTPHIASVIDGVRSVAIDASGNGAHWDIAAKTGSVFWFLSHAPHNIPLCTSVGIAPVVHGGSSGSAAVSVAIRLGCERVVLVGHDLSYAGGRAYASGAGWDGLTYENDGDGVFRFVGREDRDELHVSQGVSSVPRKRPVVDVPAIGGGYVPTVVDYLHQIRWLEKQPVRRAPVECINATSRGAHIDGWTHKRLADIDRRSATNELPRVECRAGVEWRDKVKSAAMEEVRKCGYMDDLAIEMITPRNKEATYRGLANPSKFVELLLAPDTIALKEADLPAQLKVEGLYVGMREAAKRARDIVLDQLEKM